MQKRKTMYNSLVYLAHQEGKQDHLLERLVVGLFFHGVPVAKHGTKKKNLRREWKGESQKLPHSKTWPINPSDAADELTKGKRE